MEPEPYPVIYLLHVSKGPWYVRDQVTIIEGKSEYGRISFFRIRKQRVELAGRTNYPKVES